VFHDNLKHEFDKWMDVTQGQGN